MGVMFFQNGRAIGTDAGWGGFTGNNNYVVRYDFTTGATGASGVMTQLDNIWVRKGGSNQTFGFKIGTGETDWCNARNMTPDSNEAAFSYSAQSGYNCLLYATGLNLLPNTRYYLFVYVTSAGAEYYTSWNCVAPSFTFEGSYTPPVSTISSISASVTTGGRVSVVMNRVSGVYHKAVFAYNGTELARSEMFESALSYVCPRSWLGCDTSARSMTVSVSVYSYSDAACTSAAGSVGAQFILNADRDMHPAFTAAAVTAVSVNTGTLLSGFVSGISRARVYFNTALIDMSTCAGAEIESYCVSVGGRSFESTAAEILTDVISTDTTLICTVTDERGFSGSIAVPLTVVPHVAPSLTGINAVRCTSTGTEDEDGAYYKVRFTVGGEDCTVSVSVKTGGSYGSETVLSDYENGVWSSLWASPRILGGSLTGDNVTLRFTVTDTAGVSSTYTVPMYRLQWAMKFNSSGTAVGFGMAPVMNNALQLPDHWRLCGGIPVLSPAAYGTASPETAVASPVEGQIYLRIGT